MSQEHLRFEITEKGYDYIATDLPSWSTDVRILDFMNDIGLLLLLCRLTWKLVNNPVLK